MNDLLGLTFLSFGECCGLNLPPAQRGGRWRASEAKRDGRGDFACPPPFRLAARGTFPHSQGEG